MDLQLSTALPGPNGTIVLQLLSGIAGPAFQDSSVPGPAQPGNFTYQFAIALASGSDATFGLVYDSPEVGYTLHSAYDIKASWTAVVPVITIEQRLGQAFVGNLWAFDPQSYHKVVAPEETLLPYDEFRLVEDIKAAATTMPQFQFQGSAMAAASATTKVTGTIKFQQPGTSSTYYACERCTVEIYEADSALYSNKLATTSTDDYGVFSATVSNYDESGTADIALIVKAQGTPGNVKNLSGSTYYLPSGLLKTDCPNTNCPLGTIQVSLSGDLNEAMYLYTGSLARSWRLAYYLGGSTLPAVDVVFPADGYTGGSCNVKSTTATDAYYCSGDKTIRLGSSMKRAFNTLAHEFGHYAMHWAYSWSSPTADCPAAGHSIDKAYNTGCAWSEGWATFYALNVFDSEAFTYYGGAVVHYETPPSSYATGDASEYRVTATLWDLVDTPHSGETYDNSDYAFSDTWTVLKAHADSTFKAYFGTWKAQSYSAANFKDCAKQNTITYT